MGKRLCFKEKSLLMVRICGKWVVLLAQTKMLLLLFFHFFPLFAYFIKSNGKNGGLRIFALIFVQVLLLKENRALLSIASFVRKYVKTKDRKDINGIYWLKKVVLLYQIHQIFTLSILTSGIEILKFWSVANKFCMAYLA